MAKVELSPQFRRDLLGILGHLSDVAGVRVARKYEARFKQAVGLVRDFPGIGTPRPELGAGTRLLLVDPYLIFYDGAPACEHVRVLRILHGRREISEGIIARGRAD